MSHAWRAVAAYRDNQRLFVWQKDRLSRRGFRGVSPPGDQGWGRLPVPAQRAFLRGRLDQLGLLLLGHPEDGVLLLLGEVEQLVVADVAEVGVVRDAVVARAGGQLRFARLAAKAPLQLSSE